MLLLNIILVLVGSVCYTAADNETLYDTYTGIPVTEEQAATYEAAGVTATCTNPVALPCDANEWRRLDGSCNNLNYVSRGMYSTPQTRLLEADYDVVNGTYNPRLKKSGEPLDPPRVIRNLHLSLGTNIGNLTQVFAYFLEFSFGDFGSPHDTLNMVANTTNCCEKDIKTEFMCLTNAIAQNDSVHQFSGIRCMNHTRPMAFQNVGCLSSDTAPDRVDFTTVFFDLSMMYYYEEGVTPRIRTYSSGLLKTEIVDGQEFSSDANETTTCFIKDAIKTGCTRGVPNVLIGTNLFVTLFWRNHNYLARNLAKINPCWDDEKLFQTARDINIAQYSQILFGELYKLMFGDKVMEEADILCSDNEFCDKYDSSIIPHVIQESSYILRVFHMIQNGDQKMYDENDNYVGQIPIGNFTIRGELLAEDKKMSKIVHGMYLQPTGRFDHTVHSELANRGLGGWQRSFDVPTADVNKGRYFGLAGYTDYLSYFTNKTYECFDDLVEFIDKEHLDMMKDNYDHPSEIELIVGAWAEKLIPGGHAPTIAVWMLMKQLRLSVVTDRHWFERPERPHAYTLEQLKEVRKSTMASFLCRVGDDVTHIQPRAFLRYGKGNKIVDCSEIPNLDISKWTDSSCSSD